MWLAYQQQQQITNNRQDQAVASCSHRAHIVPHRAVLGIMLPTSRYSSHPSPPCWDWESLKSSRPSDSPPHQFLEYLSMYISTSLHTCIDLDVCQCMSLHLSYMVGPFSFDATLHPSGQQETHPQNRKPKAKKYHLPGLEFQQVHLTVFSPQNSAKPPASGGVGVTYARVTYLDSRPPPDDIRCAGRESPSAPTAHSTGYGGRTNIYCNQSPCFAVIALY